MRASARARSTYEIIPVFCGIGLQEQGRAGDARRGHRLPAVADGSSAGQGHGRGREGQRRAPRGDNEPFSALAFKIMTDPFVGSLTFFRVYSGMLNSGDTVYNPVKSQARSASAASCRCTPTSATRSRKCCAGDIAAAVGLKDVTTGDTLCALDNVITLERMIFPEPVISMAVEPKTKADQEKMGIALGRLAQEDPSFRVRTDEESGQTIISGMGELHLEIIVDRMKREFNVEANVGKPQVAYRETIRKACKQEGKFVRQSGGRGQYGHVVHRDRAAGARRGYVFENAIVGGVGSEGIHPGGRQGHPGSRCRTACSPASRSSTSRSTLVDGSYHDVDSNEMAFKIAGSMALQGRLQEGEPGAARADHEGRGGDARGLHGRRDGRSLAAVAACCRASDESPSGKVINAQVPLGEMFGYATVDALDVAGSRHLHDGIRPLRRSAEQHRRSRSSRSPERSVQHQDNQIRGRQSWQRVSSSAPSRT